MKYRLLVDFEVIQMMDRLNPANRRLWENRFIRLQDFSTHLVITMNTTRTNAALRSASWGDSLSSSGSIIWTGTSSCSK